MAGSTIKVAITADNSGLSKGLKTSESHLASFAKKAAKMGVVAGAAATVGLVKLGTASVKAASDAQQSLGATETVFGKFAGKVETTSNRAARAFGLSANEYRENANTLGSLFKNQGVDQDRLANKTRKMIKTGADLSATFGGTTKDAVEALGSAFKGEFDPLERYGISIKQSAVNTEAYRIAGVKTKKAFDALSSAQQTQAKQQATTNLLTKQASQTQGAFRKETGTLAHQTQVLGAQWTNLKAKIGTALLPSVTQFVAVLNDKLMPALSKLADKYLPKVAATMKGWLKGVDDKKLSDIGDSLKDIDWDSITKSAGDLGETFKKLGPALKEVSVDQVNDGFKVFGEVVGFAADHIDLLKKALPYLVAGFLALKAAQLANQTVGKDSLIGFGLQITSTFALVRANRQLAASYGQVNAAQGGTAGGLTNTATKLTKMGKAARGAAGVAGIGALAATASTSNKALSVLGSTASGALLGFSVGGPVGAAVGGLAGALLGLATNTDTAAKSARDASIDEESFKAALDNTNAAITEQNKVMVLNSLQKQGLIAAGAEIGVSARTLVGAFLGESTAVDTYNAKLAAAKAGLQTYTNFQTGEVTTLGTHAGAVGKLTRAYGEQSTKYAQQVTEMQAQIAATRNYSGLLKGLPPAAKTDIRANGIIPTIASVKELAVKYHMTPEQVKTTLKAAGVDASTKDIKRINAAVKAASQAKVDPKPLKDSVVRSGKGAKDAANKGGKDTGKSFATAVAGAAKVNGAPIKASASKATNGAKGTAKAGGFAVGAAMANGATTGVNSKAGDVAAAAAAMVRRAISAARAEAQAQSPSRKTHQLGRDMGDGLARGMHASHARVNRAGRALVAAATKGMDKGLDAINAAIERTNALIRKRITGKKQAKRENAIIKRYAKTYAALRANGRAQDANNKLIDDAVQKVKDLKQAQADYSAAIKDSVVAYGSITALGQDTGFGSVEQLISNLQTRVNQAAEFSTLIKNLQAQGLNQTNIQQLLDAGVEGGLGTAQTIAAGGKAAITQINALTSQLTKTGTDLGTTMGKKFYDVGIKTAQGVVDGLKAKQAQLDRAALRLGQRLAAAVRRALGIRSPSKVFADIGQMSVKGLDIGLDDTYAAKSGANLAASLQKGFGQPDLTAAASTGPYGASGMTLTANVTLTATQLSQLERGRQVQLDLDAYRSVGGRARS